jgi:hypothetical protein
MRAEGFAHWELALALGVLTHGLWMFAHLSRGDNEVPLHLSLGSRPLKASPRFPVHGQNHEGQNHVGQNHVFRCSSEIDQRLVVSEA